MALPPRRRNPDIERWLSLYHLGGEDGLSLVTRSPIEFPLEFTATNIPPEVIDEKQDSKRSK